MRTVYLQGTILDMRMQYFVVYGLQSWLFN